MGRLPSIKNIKTEDFQDQRGWINKLLSPLNQFILTVYNTLNANVEFESNIKSKIQTLVIQNSSAIDYDTLKIPISFKPQGVQIINIVNKTDTTTLTSAVGIEWIYNGQGQVFITNLVGLVSSKKYHITFLII